MNINIYPIHKEFQALLELYPPVKAKDFLPEWYKKQGNFNKYDLKFGPTIKSAKVCPAITYELTNGIILPAWSDVIIRHDKKEVQWYCSAGDYNWRDSVVSEFDWLSNHNSKQTEHMDLNIGDYGAIKLNSPYYIQTEKGVATKFTDVFHHIRRNVQLIPATVETDIWHEVNFPFQFTKPLEDNLEENVIIKAGDPLVMLTPIKTNKIKPTVTINKYNQDFIDEFHLHEMKHRSQSLSWRKYKQYRKALDEEE